MPKQAITKREMGYHRTVALRLYTVRKMRQIRQEDISLRTDIPRSGISKIESGHQVIPLHVLPVWCGALDIEPWQVLHPDWETLCRKE